MTSSSQLRGELERHVPRARRLARWARFAWARKRLEDELDIMERLRDRIYEAERIEAMKRYMD